MNDGVERSSEDAESPSAPARLATLANQYASYLPVAAAIILSIPVLVFTYLWDDYIFLTNAMFYQLHDWVPAASDPFYRPISRGIYFTLLDLAGKDGAVLGHILNLAFLAVIILLLQSFTARLSGKRAGLLSGFLFACLGVVPLLVGWICCDQDLIAIVFVLIALHLRLQQRDGLALVAMAAGLLSKETTLAVVPAVVLFNWIIGRKPYRIGRSIALYTLLVAAWGALHPAVRILVSRGLRSGATGYVGLGDPTTWPGHFARYLLASLNLPAIFPVPEWPVYGVLMFLAVFALVRVTLLAHRDGDPENLGIPRRGPLLLGAMLAVGPILLTATMVEGWSPYYAAFPALGVSLILAGHLATRSIRFQTFALAIYVALGLWLRGPVKKLTEVTEPNFGVVNVALRKVEGGFRKLYKTFPADARVYLSVQAGGAGSLYTHMYSFQVLRIWYRERSLYALRPEARLPGAYPEFLTVITADRDVVDINRQTLRARSASGREPEYESCERAVRAYATGLAASGEPDAAVQILLHMPEVSAGLANVHRRVAAMFLLAEGREREAQGIIDSTVVLPRGIAIEDLGAVLAERPPSRTYDEVALRAFGFAVEDTAAVVDLMRWFERNNYADAALRFANRLKRLDPGNHEAAVAVREMTALVEERKNSPVNAAADVERPALPPISE